jgi:hypothetical protein
MRDARSAPTPHTYTHTKVTAPTPPVANVPNAGPAPMSGMLVMVQATLQVMDAPSGATGGEPVLQR